MRARRTHRPRTTRKGWLIVFTPNVHMYAHRLTASKGGRALNVPCEDTPDGYVDIWPYQLQLEPTIERELLCALREWAPRSGLRYRLYTDRDTWETMSPLSHSLRNALLIVLFLVAMVIVAKQG